MVWAYFYLMPKFSCFLCTLSICAYFYHIIIYNALFGVLNNYVGTFCITTVLLIKKIATGFSVAIQHINITYLGISKDVVRKLDISAEKSSFKTCDLSLVPYSKTKCKLVKDKESSDRVKEISLNSI